MNPEAVRVAASRLREAARAGNRARCETASSPTKGIDLIDLIDRAGHQLDKAAHTQVAQAIAQSLQGGDTDARTR